MPNLSYVIHFKCFYKPPFLETSLISSRFFCLLSFKIRLLEPLTDRMQLHFVMAELNTCIGHSTVPP